MFANLTLISGLSVLGSYKMSPLISSPFAMNSINLKLRSCMMNKFMSPFVASHNRLNMDIRDSKFNMFLSNVIKIDNLNYENYTFGFSTNLASSQDGTQIFINCTFTNINNGAISYDLSQATGTRTNFTLSKCSFVLCANEGEGGALSMISVTGSINIWDCQFTQCTSSLDGGAIFAQFTENINFRNDIFTQCNCKLDGGALSIEYSGNQDRTLENCTFENCSSTNTGGSIYINNGVGYTKILNCIFRSSSSSSNGTAIYVENNIILDGCSFFDCITQNLTSIVLLNNTDRGNYALGNPVFIVNNNLPNNLQYYVIAGLLGQNNIFNNISINPTQHIVNVYPLRTTIDNGLFPGRDTAYMVIQSYTPPTVITIAPGVPTPSQSLIFEPSINTSSNDGQVAPGPNANATSGLTSTELAFVIIGAIVAFVVLIVAIVLIVRAAHGGCSCARNNDEGDTYF